MTEQQRVRGSRPGPATGRRRKKRHAAIRSRYAAAGIGAVATVGLVSAMTLADHSSVSAQATSAERRPEVFVLPAQPSTAPATGRDGTGPIRPRVTQRADIPGSVSAGGSSSSPTPTTVPMARTHGSR